MVFVGLQRYVSLCCEGLLSSLLYLRYPPASQVGLCRLRSLACPHSNVPLGSPRMCSMSVPVLLGAPSPREAGFCCLFIAWLCSWGCCPAMGVTVRTEEVSGCREFFCANGRSWALVLPSRLLTHEETSIDEKLSKNPVAPGAKVGLRTCCLCAALIHHL